MATKIRLTRLGGHKRPYYRIVVTDARTPRDGRAIETIGYYDPLVEEGQVKLEGERLKHWIDQGAEPSATVRQIMKKVAKTAESQA